MYLLLQKIRSNLALLGFILSVNVLEILCAICIIFREHTKDQDCTAIEK